MTNTKITERDIYTAILNGTVDTDVLKAFAEKKIAQLDKRNESAKIRAAKKKAEGDQLMDAVFGFITDEAQTRANGQIAKVKGRVAGEDGKSKAVTLYATEFVDE